MCDGAPERRSPYADEGTQAHELLEQALLGAVLTSTADIEMIGAINTVISHVLSIQADNVFDWRIEHRGLVPSEAAPGQVGGTVDVMIYLPSIKTLHVIDFKYGAGVPVEVKDNKQLRVYGVQAINSDFGWKIEKVILTIIQPRASHPDGPIRSEELSVADLIDFHADIEDAVARCLAPGEPRLVPGPEQCRWCPAASFCPAREAQALAVIGNSFGHIREVTKETLPDPKGLTLERIGQILAAKDLVEDWLKTVEEEAFKAVMNGARIPGRKLVQPIGRRQWTGDVVENAILLGSATDTDGSEWVEKKLIGITEAEKRLKPYGKKALALMDSLTVKSSSGKLQLVSENDKRPAVDPAVQAFKDVVRIDGV
jgi:Protein of unknown function (DUF2800)